MAPAYRALPFGPAIASRVQPYDLSVRSGALLATHETSPGFLPAKDKPRTLIFAQIPSPAEVKS